jgi:hypothetical protein
MNTSSTDQFDAAISRRGGILKHLTTQSDFLD